MPRSYVTNLRKGRIENPGYEKMLAIAKAMGFPPGAWFDEIPAGAIGIVADEGLSLAGRLEHLFDAFRNPHTGESYANAEVARMTLGDLSEDDVEGIRIGTLGGRMRREKGLTSIEESVNLLIDLLSRGGTKKRVVGKNRRE